MANIIQIKRSAGNTAPPSASLNYGELAYSFEGTSDSLFIGDSGGDPVRIGGGRYVYLQQSNTGTPGALTANAVVITNGNSFVSGWKTNSLTVGADGETVAISNVSTAANTTQLGADAGGANTELATTWAIKTYVDGKAESAASSVAGSIDDGELTFSNNGVLEGSANLLFFSSNNTIFLGDDTSGTLILSSNATVSTLISYDSASFGGLLTSQNINTGTANLEVVNGNYITLGQYILAPNGYFGSSTGNTHIAQDLITIQDGTNTTTANTTEVNITDGTNTTSANTTKVQLADGSNTASLTSSMLTVWQANIVSQATISTANVTNMTVSQDLVVAGNLDINGTLTTIDTVNLVVSDPLIRLANGNLTTDTVDIGFWGAFGNDTVTQYTGLVRDSSAVEYVLFTGAIPAPDTTVDTANVNYSLAAIRVGDLRTASANITGGVITGITDLAVADGGTGASTFTANGVIFGNGTSALQVTAAGTEGLVLQANSSGAPEFASLDGGTF